MLRPSSFKTAHRFQGAEEVNVHCLGVIDDHFQCTMNEEVVDKIVPLLVGLPKLQKAYVGRCDLSLWSSFSESPPRWDGHYWCYYPSKCKSPPNHEALFNRLILAFSGAFRDGSLPQHLELRQFDFVLSCRGSRKRSKCEICRNICETFPFKCLLKPKMCYSFRERLPIIAARPGGREFLQSKEPLLEMLGRHVVRGDDGLVDTETDEPHSIFRIVDYKSKDLDAFDLLVEKYGCDPDQLTKEEVDEALGLSIHSPPVNLRAILVFGGAYNSNSDARRRRRGIWPTRVQ